MVEQEAFICPFCGAPYRTLIPVGTVQVKCQYCGSTVLVPPRLGGAVQRCPNHPDVLSVGLCNDCGKSYCDHCLYVYKVRDGKLHLCSKCNESRNSMKRVGAIFFLALSIIFFALFFILPANTRAATLTLTLSFLGSSIPFLLQVQKKPLSVHDAPRAFLKKCVECGKEIPIASEECQYCGTKQPEYVEP